MSLTSYRAAPPRGGFFGDLRRVGWRGVWVCRPFGIVFERYGRGVRAFRALVRSGGDLLSHVLRRSTIGAAALNGRVRNGTGCFARAVTTRPGKRPGVQVRYTFVCLVFWCTTSSVICDASAVTGSDQACRAISTGQLSALLRLHLRPIDVVVFHGPLGYLVSRGASRLDAFSGYPVRS